VRRSKESVVDPTSSNGIFEEEDVVDNDVLAESRERIEFSLSLRSLWLLLTH